MIKTVLLAGAAALAFSGGAFAATPSMTHKGFAHRTISHLPGSTTLYDQNSNDSGTGLASMNFSSGGLASEDSYGADDFVVPAGHKWTVKEVDVTGVYYNGIGPATTVNVLFYKDKDGHPGKLIAECDNLAPTGGPSFTLKLPKDGCTAKAKLSGGASGNTYWVSVVANINFGSGAGQWGWELSTVINNTEAQWENPGGGFGTGCDTWGPVGTCVGFTGDFMFALQGKDKS